MGRLLGSKNKVHKERKKQVKMPQFSKLFLQRIGEYYYNRRTQGLHWNKARDLAAIEDIARKGFSYTSDGTFYMVRITKLRYVTYRTDETLFPTFVKESERLR